MLFHLFEKSGCGREITVVSVVHHPARFHRGEGGALCSTLRSFFSTLTGVVDGVGRVVRSGIVSIEGVHGGSEGIGGILSSVVDYFFFLGKVVVEQGIMSATTGPAFNSPLTGAGSLQAAHGQT